MNPQSLGSERHNVPNTNRPSIGYRTSPRLSHVRPDDQYTRPSPRSSYYSQPVEHTRDSWANRMSTVSQNSASQSYVSAPEESTVVEQSIEKPKDTTEGRSTTENCEDLSVRYPRIGSGHPRSRRFFDPEGGTNTIPLTAGEYHFLVRFELMRHMTWTQRREEMNQLRVFAHVVPWQDCTEFILALARCLLAFGAPSHRLESQLLTASHTLNVQAEFVCLPTYVMATFGDPEEHGKSEIHAMRVPAALSLGKLRKIHLITKDVLHDRIDAVTGKKLLQEVLTSPAEYDALIRYGVAFLTSAIICPLGFGGSFIDLWIAGVSSIMTSYCKQRAFERSMYSSVFEIFIAIFTSFIARAVSSVRSQIFCYNAIASAGIVTILPGYLVLTASLELGSRSIVNGSVKMVWSLVYALFIGFGLQIGSDLFLNFDRAHKEHLKELSGQLFPTVEFIGSYIVTKGDVGSPQGTGTFKFTNATTFDGGNDWILGCYRPPHFPWYAQPWPWWQSFILVPIFSVVSSIANGQPWRELDMVVMVVIACIAYGTNVTADYYIFDRSDIVSSIGAFMCGILGNIYSRCFGGTAFTVMVTGVLFLVPSGLSLSGGITAEPDVVDISSAMVSVSIGITVGLFMSQVVVYWFGRKNKGLNFSF